MRKLGFNKRTAESKRVFTYRRGIMKKVIASVTVLVFALATVFSVDAFTGVELVPMPWDDHDANIQLGVASSDAAPSNSASDFSIVPLPDDSQVAGVQSDLNNPAPVPRNVVREYNGVPMPHDPHDANTQLGLGNAAPSKVIGNTSIVPMPYDPHDASVQPELRDMYTAPAKAEPNYIRVPAPWDPHDAQAQPEFSDRANQGNQFQLIPQSWDDAEAEIQLNSQR